MRVRHLQTYLSEHKLLQTGKLEVLKDMRVGTDAVYWMRTLQGLKDPLADAIGGLPPSVFGTLDTQIELFKKHEITTVFVFQGMQPRSHMLFSSQLHQQMDEAWHHFAKGDRQAAQAKFAQATSRINSDFVQFTFHYLKSKDCNCFQAPYFATAQLAYLVECNFFDVVIGPPALLLFGVPRVVVNIDWQKGEFEWVEQQQLLQTWQVTKEQFIDACLLAGTEYCLTFPYLNLTQFHHGQQQFTFGTAIEFIKQAPLISYMQHFPNEEMKDDHVDGYCVCKSLVRYSLVLQLNATVGPLTNGILATDRHQNIQPCVPKDYYKIVGDKLPISIYFLMAEGILSRKLPSVLALGEWLDYSHPTVDSIEYRDLLIDIREYRCRALGLIAMRLNHAFRSKPIRFSRYSCNFGTPSQSRETYDMYPIIEPGKCWSFTAEDVRDEMLRQGVQKVNLKFCLTWHAYAQENSFDLFSVDSSTAALGPNIGKQDGNSMMALVQFMLLENLGYFTEEGGTTVFGSALVETPPEMQEDALFALELMKFGLLSGEPLEAPKDRPYPENIQLLRNPNVSQRRKHSIILVSRVTSLCQMQLKSTGMWGTEVEFDLAAFHSTVKILKRSLRQLTEACLSNLLLKDVSKVQILPKHYFNPQDPLIPCFFLPRNCMGIIIKYFLEYMDPEDHTGLINRKENANVDVPENNNDNYSEINSGDLLSQFEVDVKRRFPCCVDPLSDMCRGIKFWKEVMRIIGKLDESIDVTELKEDMEVADAILMTQINALGLSKHPAFTM